MWSPDMPISEEHRKRRGRNLAMAGALFALVVLFFVITVVKFQGATWGQW